MFGIDGTFSSMIIRVTPLPSFWLSPLVVANGASPPVLLVLFFKRLLVVLLLHLMCYNFQIGCFIFRSVPRNWGLLSITCDPFSVKNSSYFFISGTLGAPIGLRNSVLSVLMIDFRGWLLAEIANLTVLMLKPSKIMFIQVPPPITLAREMIKFCILLLNLSMGLFLLWTTAIQWERGLIILLIFMARPVFIRGGKFFTGSSFLVLSLMRISHRSSLGFQKFRTIRRGN